MHGQTDRARGGAGSTPTTAVVGTELQALVSRVDVVRSSGRRRTSAAGVRDGRVVVRVPARLAPSDVEVAVLQLVERLVARATAPVPPTPFPAAVPVRPTRGQRGPRGDAWLVGRADAVAARHLGDVRAASVHWSHRMQTRWASCTTPPGRIRVSHRLADAPAPVLDNVLLHELAHVVEPHHGTAFHALADRDPAGPDVALWLRLRSRTELRQALGLGLG